MISNTPYLPLTHLDFMRLISVVLVEKEGGIITYTKYLLTYSMVQGPS